MLWIFNPPCPRPEPTHPFSEASTHYGIGIAQSAPRNIYLRTGPATSDLPEWPEAIGEARITAFFPTDEPIAWETALWRHESNDWQLSLRSFSWTDPGSDTLVLQLGWYLWHGSPIGIEPGDPPIYFAGPNEGGFDPLIGGRFIRVGTVGEYNSDGQPLYVDVWPIWP